MARLLPCILVVAAVAAEDEATLVIARSSEWVKEKIDPFLQLHAPQGPDSIGEAYVVDAKHERRPIHAQDTPPWQVDMSDLQFPVTFTLGEISEQAMKALSQSEHDDLEKEYYRLNETLQTVGIKDTTVRETLVASMRTVTSEMHLRDVVDELQATKERMDEGKFDGIQDDELKSIAIENIDAELDMERKKMELFQRVERKLQSNIQEGPNAVGGITLHIADSSWTGGIINVDNFLDGPVESSRSTLAGKVTKARRRPVV